MNLDKIPKVGTTIGRKRFWDKARDIVVSLQKKEGRNVSVDERKGAGTVINVLRPDNQPQNITGACCVDGECSITTESECSYLGGNYQGNGTTCEDVDCTQGACCHPDGSCDVQTSEDCLSDGGAYQGDGTTCEDVDCTHTGACCRDGDCTIETESYCEAIGGTYQGDDTTCEGVDCGTATSGACCVGETCTIETPDGCSSAEGIYQGDNTDCDPNPCLNPECECSFDDGMGGHWLSKTVTIAGSSFCDDPDICNGTEEATWEFSIDPDTCETSLFCSGSGTLTSGESETEYVFAFDPDSNECRWNDETADVVAPIRCFGFSSAGCASTEDAPCSQEIHPFPSEPECVVQWEMTVDYSNPCTPV